ncbi:hypothetical protein [Alteribacter natronophilus]|uniref:hypothetical protein n=1 Tax=Alteribacter natronophilus TaxID=2583810 RepID=UPI00110E2869|nr:hypothetical protein [Alteribacter natronophilus]TMW72400.1 hypothetical protein FGB90_09360 [Alteribacter natronophilus]
MAAAVAVPAFISIGTMFTALYIHVLLERVFTNEKQSLAVLHFPNIMFSWMMYALPSVIIRGFLGTDLITEGWLPVLYHSVIVPLPFLLSIYPVVALLFRRSLRRYIAVKGSNVVYLKKKPH